MVTKDEIIAELKQDKESSRLAINELLSDVKRLEQELCEQRKYNNNANKKIQKLEETLAKMQDDTFIRMDRDMLKKFKEFCKNG